MKKPQKRFPWVAAGAAAALLVVGTVAWLQIPAAPKSVPSPSGGTALPTLTLTQADGDAGRAASANALAEKLSAYDPTVLFLPSAMNSGQKVFHPEGPSNDGGPFGDLGPRLVFNAQKAALPFPAVAATPAGPVEALTLIARRDAPVIGRTDGEGGALPARLASVQAARPEDGRVVMALTLPLSAAAPQTDWRPLELVGAVSSTGLVGDLAVSESSGSAEVDAFFAGQLAKGTRVGERLSPGVYVFRVGP